MKSVYLHSTKNPSELAAGSSARILLSRNDYLFYSFPVPPIATAEMREYLLLRIKNVYPGDLNNTEWFYFVQKQTVFAIVINERRHGILKEAGLMDKLLLPPSCRKKYPSGGKFDMLIEYPDCFELISVENNSLTGSHVFSTVANPDSIEKRLSLALKQFSCSDRIVLCLENAIPGIDSALKTNYGEIETIACDDFFNVPSGNCYKPVGGQAKRFPIPQSVRMLFYLMLSFLLVYLGLDAVQSEKEKAIFTQESRIQQLETLKTASEEKLAKIALMEEELNEIRERGGSNVHSFLSALALEMEGAIFYTVTLSGSDYELTGIHNNPLILVDSINNSEILGTMKLRSSVPDPDSGKQYFSISGKLK